MSTYRESETDRKNRHWFANNKSCNTLQKIAVNQSSIRGMGPFSVEFNYPITVIAGENGCGKSTILSLVSCAFHNNTSFCPMSLLSNGKNQRIYYTYSDFFAFTVEERGIMRDIQITSTFLTDKTKNTDIRSKSPGKGQWKDYDTRPKRAVSFLGINRILPPSESITYRNYSAYFNASELTDVESLALTNYMTRIFGKQYETVFLRKHNKKYRLYGCGRGGGIYSGFNMGAGENAVLQLLHEIINAGNGALIVVDEIELGLHVKAQEQLMKVLKELCEEKKTQIICSSHSATVIGAVPPDGRILLKSKQGGVDIIYKITPEMAMSELSGELHTELAVFVEDEMAKDFLHVVMPNAMRRRVEIMIVGSADGSMLNAVSTHLREGKKNFIIVMDGDKRSDKTKKINTIISSLSDRPDLLSEEIKNFIDERLTFLPGSEWPEKVLLNRLQTSDDLNRLMSDCNIETMDEMRKYIDTALASGKHNEFYQLSKELYLNESDVRFAVIRQYKAIETKSIQPILDIITHALN